MLFDANLIRPTGPVPKPWYREGTKSWYMTLNGHQIRLGRDKKMARQKYARIMTEAGQADRLVPPEKRPKPPIEVTEDQRMIYFVQNLENKTIKIGISVDPIARLKSLQNGNAHRLALLGAVRGDLKDERALHRRFKVSRLKGEWFRETPELLAAIAEVCG